MERFVLKNFTLIRTIIAILLGVAISIILIAIISSSPGFSLKQFFLGQLLSKSRLANIVESATPVVFTGIAISIAFQARQFNIGAEGSFYLSAAVATAFGVSTSMPAILHIPAILLVAALTGAVYGLVPGILKAKLHASELVASLMMN